MLRQGIQKVCRFTTAVNTRAASNKPPPKDNFWLGHSKTGKKKWYSGVTTTSSSDVTWSGGEITSPTAPDCPLGNKGEYPQKLPDGSLQYFGFQYYPRNPDEVDPPYEPAPLHLVTRIKSLKKKPYWDKDIMRRFGLDKKRSDIAIVKNNPENNAYLWRVKHLVKITPLRIPKDLPEDADPRCCFIKESGEFIYSPTIKVEEDKLEEPEDLSRKKMSLGYIDNHTRKNWQHPWQLKLC